MIEYSLRRVLTNWVTLAKILNIIAFLLSLVILAGGLMTYDWARMPYTETSSITQGGAVGSLVIFSFITFTLAFSYYIMRRLSKGTI